MNGNDQVWHKIDTGMHIEDSFQNYNIRAFAETRTH